MFLAPYSSVPNRRAVRNKRTGGKILKKNIKHAGQNKHAGRKIYLKNIKRAGRNKRAGGNFCTYTFEKVCTYTFE